MSAIPADASLGWWLGFAALYLFVGFMIWLVAGGIAEEHKPGSFWRVTLATLAAFWLVWPLALPLSLIWVVGFGAIAMTCDAWKLRGKP